jgi:hypothetical protein
MWDFQHKKMDHVCFATFDYVERQSFELLMPPPKISVMRSIKHFNSWHKAKYQIINHHPTAISSLFNSIPSIRFSKNWKTSSTRTAAASAQIASSCVWTSQKTTSTGQKSRFWPSAESPMTFSRDKTFVRAFRWSRMSWRTAVTS